MKVQSTPFLLGIFLILIGAFFLVTTLTEEWINEEYAFAIVFFTAGIVLILAYFIFSKKLWTLILGAIGIFIGSAIYIDESRILTDDAIGIVFLVILGLVFLNALRSGKKNWWVIIPGGFCFVLAAHVFVEMNYWFADEYHGVIFFCGGGIIFGILYLLKDENYPLDWAKYPSIISFAIAGIVMMTVDFRDFFSRIVFPGILIALGILVLVRSLRQSQAVTETSQTPPPEKPPEKPAEKPVEKTAAGTAKRTTKSGTSSKKNDTK